MSEKSWTWFDREIEEISSISSSIGGGGGHSLTTSRVSLTKSTISLNQDLIYSSNGFIIGAPADTTSNTTQLQSPEAAAYSMTLASDQDMYTVPDHGHYQATSHLPDHHYQVTSDSNMSKGSLYDLGYQTQSKSCDLNLYDDVQSLDTFDVDLVLSDMSRDMTDISDVVTETEPPDHMSDHMSEGDHMSDSIPDPSSLEDNRSCSLSLDSFQEIMLSRQTPSDFQSLHGANYTTFSATNLEDDRTFSYHDLGDNQEGSLSSFVENRGGIGGAAGLCRLYFGSDVDLEKGSEEDEEEVLCVCV